MATMRDIIGSVGFPLEERQKDDQSWTGEKPTRKGAFKFSSKEIDMIKKEAPGVWDKTGGPDSILFKNTLKMIGDISYNDLPRLFDKENMADAQDLIANKPKKALQLFLRNVSKVKQKLGKYIRDVPENVPLIFYSIMARVSGKEMAMIQFKRYFTTDQYYKPKKQTEGVEDMENDILKFLEMTKRSISKEDQRTLRFGLEEENAQYFHEGVASVTKELSSYNSIYAGRPLVPYQGKNSDSEIVFFFEDRKDAVDLYDFMTDTGMLEPGEVVFRDIEGQYSVAFMPHVAITKPEMLQAAMLAYEEQMDFSEDEDAFESFVGELTDLLTETRNKTSGAPKRKKGMGNPFHDKDDGKFAGVDNHAKKSGGSWAIGKRKLKFTGAGKTADKKGILGKYGSTKHPCGRAARAKGKDTRCWDGNQGAGFRVAKALKKKRRGEDFDMTDMMILVELKEKYRRQNELEFV